MVSQAGKAAPAALVGHRQNLAHGALWWVGDASRSVEEFDPMQDPQLPREDAGGTAPSGRRLGLEPIGRLGAKHLLMVIALAASVYALIPQFTDLRGAADQIRNANWGWVALAVLATPVMYLGAASSIAGATPDPIRPVPTLLTQVASSFTTKLAPSSVGGMTLNVRFLQHQGVDRSVAATAVGVNSVSGFVVHTLLLALFAAGAGRSDDVRLPKPEALAIGGAGVVVISVIAFAVPSVRRAMATRVLPGLRRSGRGIAMVFRRPADLARLLGGNAIVVFSLLAAFVCCVKAFGGDLRLVGLAAAYLAGSSVSIISPTPGGLGAIEVALVGTLVAAGTPDKIAVPAVFLFRLITFWIPMLPGWLSLRWLRRRDLA